MYSTMQDFPLTIAAIMRHGCGVHGARTVTTATTAGYRHTSYHEVGRQAAQLANALRGIGVSGDQRVATFMWNNAEHLTAYLAVPSMGAVLHTLNIRLFPGMTVLENLLVAQHNRLMVASGYTLLGVLGFPSVV